MRHVCVFIYMRFSNNILNTSYVWIQITIHDHWLRVPHMPQCQYAYSQSPYTHMIAYNAKSVRVHESQQNNMLLQNKLHISPDSHEYFHILIEIK